MRFCWEETWVLGQIFDNVLTRLLSTLAPNKSDKCSCLCKLFSDRQPRGSSKALGCQPRVLQVRSGGSLCRCNGPADTRREKPLEHAKQHTSVLINWRGTSHAGKRACREAVCLPSVGKGTKAFHRSEKPTSRQSRCADQVRNSRGYVQPHH